VSQNEIKIKNQKKKPEIKRECLTLARFLYGVYQKQKTSKNRTKVIK